MHFLSARVGAIHEKLNQFTTHNSPQMNPFILQFKIWFSCLESIHLQIMSAIHFIAENQKFLWEMDKIFEKKKFELFFVALPSFLNRRSNIRFIKN